MRPAAFLLVAALLTAGCAGGGRPSQVTTTLPPQDGGSVTGLVVDDAGLPVEMAEATFLDVANSSTTSGADGRFTIAGVPAGKHELVVSKIGFATARKNILVSEGETLDLEVNLIPIPKPNLERIQVLPGKAFLSCSFTSAAFEPTLTQMCGWDTNNDPLFHFDVDVTGGLVAILVEMSWLPSTPYTAKELRLGLWRNPTCSARCTIEGDQVYGPYVTGASPVRKVVGNATTPVREGLNQDKPTTIAAVVLVREAKPVLQDPADFSLVWQQSVDLYASVYYNKDVSAGDSALPR